MPCYRNLDVISLVNSPSRNRLLNALAISCVLTTVGVSFGEGKSANTKQAGQTIAFSASSNRVVGATVTLTAVATSGLSVAFQSNTPAVCVVSGSTITLAAEGQCTIQANQAGNSAYSPAPPVSQSFIVNAAAAISGPAPTAMPSDYGFSGPDPEPALPSNLDAFTPPLYAVNPSAPAVAEWTRSAGPGNAIEFSLAASTAGTTFLVYGQNSEARTTPLSVIPAVLDYTPQGSSSGEIASIILPSTMSGLSPGMYLVWPQNSIGTGAPVAINRTDAWWLGPGAATEGDTVFVFGQNLTYPGTYAPSVMAPLVYLVSADGAGGTYLPQVTSANPYRVGFSTSEVNPGLYNVWVHNGAGGNFGWSGPLPLTVSATSPWNCQSSGPSTFSVKSYGATGNSVADDTAAITATISAAGIYALNASHRYATIYFPPGIYMVSMGFRPPSNVCFMGAGTSSWQTQTGSTGSASILRLSHTTATLANLAFPQTSQAFIWGNEGGGSSNNVEFTNLVLDANGNIPSVWSSPGVYATLGAQVRFRSSKNVKFDSIVLNGAGPTIYGAGFESFDFLGGQNYYLTNSTIIGTGIWNDWTKQVFVSGNLFLAADNSLMMIVNAGSVQTAFSSNTQEDLEYFNTLNPSAQIPYSYGSASYAAAIAGQSLIGTGLGPYGLGRIGGSESYEVGQLYIGQNTNINAGPCDPTNTSGTYPNSYPGCATSTNSNSGEQVLFETEPVDFGGPAMTSTATTVTVSGLTETSCGIPQNSNCVGEDAVISGGTGLGQNRHIIAQNGSTLTLSAPWMVNPDATSTIYISNVTYQAAVYDNVEQGKADQASRYTALGGVESWGGAYELVYDGNQVSNVGTGIAEVTLQTYRPNEDWIAPNYFSLFCNNKITSAIVGVNVVDGFYGGTGDPRAVAFLGNVFRNNTFGTSDSSGPIYTGIYGKGIRFSPHAASAGEGNAIQGVILDGNAFVVDDSDASGASSSWKRSAPAGLWTDNGNALIIDTLFNNNSFSLVGGLNPKNPNSSYGIVFGSDTKNGNPASAIPGDSCVEAGRNSIAGFATSSYGLTCTQM